MGLLLVTIFALLVGLALLELRLQPSPRCPGCGACAWNRRMYAPLLFCRRCHMRVDARGLPA